MNKAFKVCSIIDLVKSIIEVVAGVVLVILGAVRLSAAEDQATRLPAAGLLFLGLVLLAIAFCAFATSTILSLRE